jgi:peptide/nickel transport system substrate-binding protein
MSLRHEQPATRRAFSVLGVLCWSIVLAGTGRCGQRSGPLPSQVGATLRVGIGGLPLLAPQAGLQQFVSNLSFEGLVNFTEDGRPRPFLAESWTTAPDGLSLTLQLHRQAKFHDGRPVTAPTIAQALEKTLPGVMGPAFDDVAKIVALDDAQVRIELRRPSRFLIEALETLIHEPGNDSVGTGPYVPAASTTASELRANADYYLGRPTIDRIVVTSYPSVRTAWAELLRGSLDMLSEVNMDALDSLQASSSVSVFSFVRHYQYVIVFGAHVPTFKSSAIRRELNAVINRETIVREALNGHGIPSSGPIPPRHWALNGDAPKLTFDPALAANLSRRHLQFTCLVSADSVYERIALVVKRQLATASVDMRVKEATQDQILQAATNNNFEAILVDTVSGPNVFRSYRHWHSKATVAPEPIGSPSIDAALDRIRHALSDDEYRQGVAAFQRAIVEEPPAIFIAWGERARAVSQQFDVPVPEDGRDVLGTLRLWRPAADRRAGNRN